MKPLRLILPITLFILSGVLALVGSEITTEFTIWCGFTSAFLLIAFFPSLVWALGGFDD